ncbi:MAG: CotH kinase family protein [Alistipes sp.]|nr:CotH kinase family protein [Alistipes sp.]
MKRFFIVISVLLAAACVKENVGDPLVKMTLKGESEAVTRTVVGEATANTTQLWWSVGDAIGVFGENTKNANFVASISEPAATALFSGAMTSGDTPQYAYFPYNSKSTSETEVMVEVPTVQTFSVGGALQGDVRVSRQMSGEANAFSTTFRSLTTLLSLNLDAAEVDGVAMTEQLRSITLSSTQGAWTGNYTVDLTQSNATLEAVDMSESKVTITFAEPMTLAEAVEVPIYAMVAPEITQGDVVEVLVQTNQTKISCRVTARVDFVAGTCYDVPLVLRHATEENDLVVEPAGEQAQFTAFKFEAANNSDSGAMLTKAAYYNGSKTTTTTSTDYIDFTMTIDEEADAVQGVIPYLYNFSLAPTFEVTEGATVWVGNQQQTSGKSVQDFSQPVTYTVRSAEGVDHNYTVTVTNNGIPVVVLTQNDPNNVYTENGSISQDGYTTYLTEHTMLGTTIPCKLTDFDMLLEKGSSTIKIYEQGVASLDATCGFRMRGNSTANFPKKPMAIKLKDKSEVLGMKKHKRWCLLASWTDRSLMRNAVAFKIANTLQNHFTGAEGAEDGYGLVWNPSGVNVELVLNGVHVGSYFLCEQIKIDDNRLNIQGEYDETKKQAFEECGFLMECDDNYDENCKFKTSQRYVPFMFKDDVPSDYQSTMKSFIDAIEQNLISGNYSEAYNSLDINSVIDWWIVYELAMNAEYRHPKSVYYYRDGAGKLFAGPVWDFDYQTFPNPTKINEINTRFGQGNYTMTYSQFISSSTLVTPTEPAVWYPLLFNDATFVARLKSRWNSVYSSLLALTTYIEEQGRLVSLADASNVAMWPFDSSERTTYSWYIDYAGDEFMTHDELVENFKSVYMARLQAMNTAINAL